MDNARKRNKPRQAWNPHWILKLLYGAWSACLAVLKIAIGAAATVLLIGIVCAFVFIGILGTYLHDDILPRLNEPDELPRQFGTRAIMIAVNNHAVLEWTHRNLTF